MIYLILAFCVHINAFTFILVTKLDALRKNSILVMQPFMTARIVSLTILSRWIARLLLGVRIILPFFKPIDPLVAKWAVGRFFGKTSSIHFLMLYDWFKINYRQTSKFWEAVIIFWFSCLCHASVWLFVRFRSPTTDKRSTPTLYNQNCWNKFKIVAGQCDLQWEILYIFPEHVRSIWFKRCN